MGTMYKRGSVWWIKYYRDGKPFRESTKSTKEGDAKRLLKKREGEIVEGKLPGMMFDRVTFDELAADLVTDYKRNGKKTLAWIERRIDLHLRPYFGGMRVPQITTSKIKAYTNLRLEEGAAPASINRELAAIKRLMNLGAKETPPKVNRVPYIPMLQEHNTRKGFFEHGEFLALRDALPVHLRGFVTFAYKTGWRFSEVAGLTWAQVDMEGFIVRLEPGETKNDDGRTVYLDRELKAALSERLKARRLGCPYVFHQHGKAIRDIRPSWAAACKEAKVEGRLFHDLRRTAVRNMVRAGIPERVAMQISGHKTRSVFDRYNIVSQEDLKQAARSLEGHIENLTGTILGTIGEMAGSDYGDNKA